MNTTVSIRPFEARDLNPCAALFVDVFNSPPWDESWELPIVNRRLDECYRTPGFFGLIALKGEDVVAFAVGYSEQWDKNRHYYLLELCVRASEQGQGIGKTLMNALEEGLLSQNIEKIYVLTARDTSAQTFYEKQGFYLSPKMVMMSKWLKT